MLDRKKSSYIFSFNKKQQFFLKGALLFFVPVIAMYVLLELLFLQIPSSYAKVSEHMLSEGKNIRVLITGSSQMKRAVNPEFLDQQAINFGSPFQQHNIDYNIITQTKSRLENVEIVVLELSYSHLELAHKTKFFWKNSTYLKFYNVNNFERQTYFKDKLLFLSRPEMYANTLVKHYLKNRKNIASFNRFGFEDNKFAGTFESLNYEEDKIPTESKSFAMKTSENYDLFEKNTSFLIKMLDYLAEKKMNVIIATIPLHRYTLKERNPNILRRRDSILKILVKKYNNIRVFKKEEDSINYKTSDYINHNHLNPRGAEKFTTELNSFIKEQFPN